MTISCNLMMKQLVPCAFSDNLGAYVVKITNMLFIFRQPIPAKRFEFI